MDNDEFDLFLAAIKNDEFPSADDVTYKARLTDCNAVQKRRAETEMKASAKRTAPVVAPPRAAIMNSGFDWLTYETLFNKMLFRKSNRQIDFGLYKIPLTQVTVFVRSRLDRSLLKTLQEAFFPTLQPGELEKLATTCCSWKGTRSAIQTAGKFAVMPYNYFDNTASSNALGTRLEGASLKKIKGKWPAWRTASRTCIVRTAAARTDVSQEVPWGEGWPFKNGEEQRHQDPVDDPSRYQLSTRTAADVSLKTGVQFVGRDNQSRADKDVLDGWYLGALRSDHVADVDAQMIDIARAAGKRLPSDLIVLTEVLAIIESQKRRYFDDPARELKEHDGVQVRDITPLDTTKIYIPPTSIPFLDHRSFNQVQEEVYSCFADPAWREFWQGAWAVSLGKAKARFLLRYGLQHINPNAQNYLIEFDRTNEPVALRPTGRIVIRDLTDAAIHREVIWALFRPGNSTPPEGLAGRPRLAELNKPYFRYEFTDRIGECQETGSTDQKFGPTGTQFLWQRFSAFINADKILMKREEYEQYDWKLLLKTMAEWGLAHNRAYVECIQHELGTTIPNVPWSQVPDQAVNDIQTISGQPLIEWEQSAAQVVHDYLRSPAGQQKVRDYRANAWNPLPQALPVTI